MNGRPLILNWADEHIPAILETWHLGTQSGNAIAEVLFGDYNPSGKLPMTFPRHLGQLPIYYNYFNTGRPGPKPEVFWSHYTDEVNQPLYPFGYGLSYTQFSYADLKVDSSNPSQILVSVSVKNTGKYSGEEVAQLYIRDKISSTVRPVKELKGFQKISIDPGQTKQVQFTLTDKELGYYNGDGQFIIENGEFEIMVGTNSQDLIKTVFTKK
jgi:beta-glucosidase